MPERSGIGPRTGCHSSASMSCSTRQASGAICRTIPSSAIYKVEGVRTLNESYWSPLRRGRMGLITPSAAAGR